MVFTCESVDLVSAIKNLQEGKAFGYTTYAKPIDQRRIDQLNYFQRAFDSVKKSIAIV